MEDLLTSISFNKTPLLYLFQSIWRDEAFSFYIANKSLLDVIATTAKDVNPPFYYLLLHFWIIFFGQTAEIARLLSFVFHLGTAYTAYLFGVRLISKKFGLYCSLFIFFNPMLLYYAFEIRMYSLYSFLSLTSLYCYYSKKWIGYVVATVLGLYTHSFFLFLPISYVIHAYIFGSDKKRESVIAFSPLLLYLPWIPTLVTQFAGAKESWILPMDIRFPLLALGNLFSGYEWSSRNAWIQLLSLSLFILAFFLYAYKNKMRKSIYFLTPIFLPLITVILFSIIFKPIFVNRYLIFVTVFSAMLIVLGIAQIKNRTFRYFVAVAWMLLIIGTNITIAPYHGKPNLRQTFDDINRIATSDDYIYAEASGGYFVSVYYYKNPDKVYIYLPTQSSMPYHSNIVSTFSNWIRTALPDKPAKTFLIRDDATYDVL